MITKEKIIAAKLQQIPENKLTKEIIIPLLDRMQYHKVEFYGGPSEQGKDIVFWDHDRINKLHLYVAQVKHFEFTNTASDSRSLQTVINQLSDCFKRKLMYTDRSQHLPTEVWLITPFEVDAKTLQSAFAENIFLQERQITIVDGLTLAGWIIRHWPACVKDLVGLKIDVASKMHPTLNNKILLSALGFHEDKDLKAIYTDIDFSIGKSSTGLFFNSKYKPTQKKIKVNRRDWDFFQDACKKVAEEYGFGFLAKTLEEIGQVNQALSDKLTTWRQNRNNLNEKLEAVNGEVNTVQKTTIELETQIDKLAKKYYKDKAALEKDPDFQLCQSRLNSAQNEIDIQHRRKIAIQNELKQLLKNEPDFDFEVEINGSQLAAQMVEKRRWVEEQIAKYNQKRPDSIILGNFIAQCQSIINASSILFEFPHYFNCIGYEANKKVRKNYETTRFKFPVDQLFDTGLNFLVLGEAGAGKTTSLQMYTTNRENITDKIIFWLPLARMVQVWSVKNDLEQDKSSYGLETGIVKYLDSIGIHVSKDDFLSLHDEKKVVLLLDGLDEAIKVAPWLPAAITDLTKRLDHNLQIIVTSSVMSI